MTLWRGAIPTEMRPTDRVVQAGARCADLGKGPGGPFYPRGRHPSSLRFPAKRTCRGRLDEVTHDVDGRRIVAALNVCTHKRRRRRGRPYDQVSACGPRGGWERAPRYFCGHTAEHDLGCFLRSQQRASAFDVGRDFGLVFVLSREGNTRDGSARRA